MFDIVCSSSDGFVWRSQLTFIPEERCFLTDVMWEKISAFSPNDRKIKNIDFPLSEIQK